MLISTMLSIFPGRTIPPGPSPTTSNGLAAAVAVLLNKTGSVGAGTPGVCQFSASDQFVLIPASASVPLHVTDGRVPIGPAVRISSTDVPSGLKAIVPA